jgi:hypothetical protein
MESKDKVQEKVHTGRGGRDKHHDGKPHQENRRRHHNHDGGEKQVRKGGAADAPKDSFYYKFHYGPWPK